MRGTKDGEEKRKKKEDENKGDALSGLGKKVLWG
jgi:hypothetical protein